MRSVQASCPYPNTCRYSGTVEGEAGCLRDVCPFRIHLRRLVAGEIHRLSQEKSLNPQQYRELEALKGQYARLLRGGDPCGETAAQAAAQYPWPESGGGTVPGSL